MRIYVSHSSGFDYQQELYAPIMDSNFWSQHQFIFPHQSSVVVQNSKSVLATCDLVLAEVSFASTGAGIEIGWADSIGIPVIGLCRKGFIPSTALKMVCQKVLNYQDSLELLKELAHCLNQLDATLAKPKR